MSEKKPVVEVKVVLFSDGTVAVGGTSADATVTQSVLLRGILEVHDNRKRGKSKVHLPPPNFFAN